MYYSFLCAALIIQSFLYTLRVKKTHIPPMKVLLIAIIIYFIIEIAITSYYYIDARSSLKNLEAKIAETTREIEELKSYIEYLKSEEFIEKYAREELMLAKEGETVIFFKNLETPEETAEQPKEENSFFRLMLNKLLNLFKK